ncbi:MAG: rhomboid family intramembrane serine protease [Deltaproteobacteria bacterium]|nr:rhomboid family intramembrane serine protease [Deltaproteobacteria bacterium]
MFAALPPLTRLILYGNALVFFLEATTGGRWMLTHLALWPLGSRFAPWQLLTYGFLHAGVGHLFFNMFAVYMFGGRMERTWGSGRFAVYYLVCLISAGLAQLAVGLLSESVAPSLGASGAVFGLLLAFGVTYPNERVVLLIPPIPMPAWLFVTLYGGLELVLGLSGWQPGVAHFAHLGGMLGGYLLIRRWRAAAQRRYDELVG